MKTIIILFVLLKLAFATQLQNCPTKGQPTDGKIIIIDGIKYVDTTEYRTETVRLVMNEDFFSNM